MRKYIETLNIIVAFLVCFFYLQDVFMPKYTKTNIPEGKLTEEYYDSTLEHEVLFIGDCEVFENISTVTLYENFGINSYIRGNAQQQVWHSYYLLEETLKYEKPKVVIFNVNALRYDEPISEPYNRLIADNMRWSASKLKMINAAKLDDESIESYIFPLLRYHDRYNELSISDFIPQNDETVSYSGYLMNCEVKPLTNLPKAEPLKQKDFSENVYDYLNKIVSLCQENDIYLILMKAPTLYPYWYDEWDDAISDYASENKVEYINFINDIEKIGLDFEKDTSDGGIHLNVTGAEKFANYLGTFLMGKYNLSDSRLQPNIASWWKPVIEKYKKEREQVK